MSIVVEHDKRRKDILEKSLDVFVDEGFENVTFQKIADRCGITRTTLYIYFRNKKEIFNYSIKILLSKMEEGIKKTCTDASLRSVDKITKVMLDIFQHLEENRCLLSVILDYLVLLAKNNIDPEQHVRRRTLRLRHIITSLVIEGVKKGELKTVNIKTTGELFYSFIEAAIFRLAVLKKETTGDLRNTAIFAANELAVT